MATGLEMYNALRKAIGARNSNGVLKINRSDKADLCKLSVTDLESLGYDRATAERVGNDLSNDSLGELGKSLGIKLEVEKYALVLIPGEGLKRAAELLKNDPQTLEEMLEELRRMRNPLRCDK
jgi:hypothetical protein